MEWTGAQSESPRTSKVSAPSERTVLEVMLVVVVLGMTYLMLRMGGYKLVALNLFFLPIVLSGYYLGRNHAGVLALFTALVVSIAATLDTGGISTLASPFTMGLALTVWASVLGLTAILVGTLCDERAAKVNELHEAYVGVVEVLSKYLQSGNPRVKARSVRTAEIAQHVADELRLPRQIVDDVRVGALLWDLENVEVTTKLLSRAVDSLEGRHSFSDKHTFLGADLVHSLAEVLRGAVPLLITQVAEGEASTGHSGGGAGLACDVPIGARIIRCVRDFDAELSQANGSWEQNALEVVKRMKGRTLSDKDAQIVQALERVVSRWKRVSPLEAAPVPV
jgi:HD-GYP domain-containing protein (c-di-GMP phosphodiesterase class II)